MSYTITSDRMRQEDEVIALSNIYEENEFSCSKNEQIKCTINIFPKLDRKLKVNFTGCSSSNATFDAITPCDKIFVEHLPPIRLYILFPDTYPSQRPPNFCLAIVWLTPWDISFVCQELDKMWKENQGSEILFLWIDFLQNSLFNFLRIQDSLDVSFMHLTRITPGDRITFRLAHLSDPRAINAILSLDLKKMLISYNREQHRKQFDSNFHICHICLEKHSGVKCIELKNCGHVYCKSCMEEYIRIKINEHVKIILCPTLNCSFEINCNDIKTLCPNLFSQYEELVLRITLNTMNDVIYCPRISCQNPMIRDNPNDVAPICPVCNYCFCIYCYKLFHGAAPCMISDDIKKLVNDYKNSDDKEKKRLENKYGKRQIQLVQETLTTEYLQNNAKTCPKCHSFISKIDGCNKMTCKYCQYTFCWLCGQLITLINGYLHFTNANSPCFGRLFEGIEDDNYYNIDNLEIMENVVWVDLNFDEVLEN
ncbi:E3 ubiquitin-protein ligase RNF14-like [Anoplolepis gracilipes]|uniref:E3 ubiquitin-protein ligase RNF14-like n=1 Tax=Anoplolepis gracilipes TaxID=354296 RepID=UPI003BA107D9